MDGENSPKISRRLTLSLNTKLSFALFGVLPYSEWPVVLPETKLGRKNINSAAGEDVKRQLSRTSLSLIRLPGQLPHYPTNLIRTRESARRCETLNTFSACSD